MVIIISQPFCGQYLKEVEIVLPSSNHDINLIEHV